MTDDQSFANSSGRAHRPQAQVRGGGGAARRLEPLGVVRRAPECTAGESAKRMVAMLAGRQFDVAEDLADAVAAATPSVWREVVDGQCRPLTHSLLPALLSCLAEDTPLTPELLAVVQESAAGYPSAGIPVGVVIRGIQAALVRFGTLVQECVVRAEPERGACVAGLVLLTSRAPLLILDVINAFVTGYFRAAHVEGRQKVPAWWTEVTPLARGSLHLAAEGMTNAQIARSLQCSSQTVNYHLRALMRRLGAPNRTALAARAQAEGLLDT